MGEIKRFFCLFLMFFCLVMGTDSVFAQDAGVTEWTKLPFGQMRLMACREGVKEKTLFAAGLQIQLNPEWYLKKPKLGPIDKNSPLWIEYPIRPNRQETQNYTSNLLIPLFGFPKDKNFHLGVQGDLTACHHPKDCLNIPIRFEMPLDKKSNSYTGYCAYIMEQIQQVPWPAPKDLIAKMKKISPNEVELSFENLENVQQAFLQNDSGVLFEIKEREFLPNGVRLKVHISSFLKDQNWILITNKGIFRIKDFLHSSDKKKISLPWNQLIFGGFFLFLCSPFFFWWGLNWPKKKGIAAFQSIKMAEQTTYIILSWGLLSVLTMNYMPWIFQIPLFLWGCFGIMIICLFFPPKNPWIIGGLFFVFPKPYLNDLFVLLNDNKTLWVAVIMNFILWAWVFFYVRFRWACFFEQKIQSEIKKSPFIINLFFLLPTLILTTILGIWLIRPLPKFETLPQKELIVVCLPYSEQCTPWREMQEMPVHLIDGRSPNGQDLLKKYRRSMEDLVIFETPFERTIFPPKVSVKTVKSFMIDWKNYHALGRPKNQPTRFADDQRAP